MSSRVAQAVGTLKAAVAEPVGLELAPDLA